MIQLVPIPFLVVTVTLLVRARLRADVKQEYIFKPLSTLLVILVALLSLGRPTAHLPFTLWVTLGLALSLGGDVALMFRANRWFLIGLGLFLLAHVVYAVTFTLPNGFHAQDLRTGVALLAFGALVYGFLLPGLRSMKVPVLIYMLVILFMVNRATSAWFGSFFSPAQAWLLALGAALFMLSDLLLAINRFRRPFKYEPLGLYIYYAGQLLIALAPAYFARGL